MRKLYAAAIGAVALVAAMAAPAAAYLFYGPTAQGCASEPTLTLAFVTAVGSVSVATSAAA
jgi:hypothetical protein